MDAFRKMYRFVKGETCPEDFQDEDEDDEKEGRVVQNFRPPVGGCDGRNVRFCSDLRPMEEEFVLPSSPEN